MNKWFRRAVGTVGIAGGICLLGSGAAHADTSSSAVPDTQRLAGLLDSLFTPAGGPTNLGLTLDTPSARTDAGLVPKGPFAVSHGTGHTGLTAHALTAGGRPQNIALPDRVPDVMSGLPITDVLPLKDLGGLALAPARTESTGGTALTGLPLLSSLPLDGVPIEGLPLHGLPLAGLPLDGLAGTDGVPVVGGLAGALPVAGTLPDAGSVAGVLPGALSRAGSVAGVLPGAGSVAGVLPGAGSAAGSTTAAGLAGGYGGALVRELSGVDSLPLGGAAPDAGALVGGLAGADPLSGVLPAASALPIGALPVFDTLANGLPLTDKLSRGGLPLGSLPGAGSRPVAGTDTAMAALPAATSVSPTEGLPVVGGLFGGADLPVLGSLLSNLGGPSGSQAGSQVGTVEAPVSSASESLPLAGGLPVFGSIPGGLPVLGSVPLVDSLPIYESLPLVGGLA